MKEERHTGETPPAKREKVKDEPRKATKQERTRTFQIRREDISRYGRRRRASDARQLCEAKER